MPEKKLPVDSYAKNLPIIDAHFHPMKFMDARELLEKMDEHHILAAGGAHRTPGALDNYDWEASLRSRWIYTQGNQMAGAVKHGGLAALEDVNNPVFKQYFGYLESEFSNATPIEQIGEIFINARTSHKVPALRYKADAFSSGVQAIYKLATLHKIPMLVHAQLDNDTANQLVKLASLDRTGILILGHCGKDSTAAEARAVLESAPNIYCNLAYRAPPQETSGDSSRYIWTYKGLKPDWKKLIEDYPDRFMVGIDDVHSWREYDAVIYSIRAFLLDNLTKDTAAKVAYLNAKKLYGI